VTTKSKSNILILSGKVQNSRNMSTGEILSRHK
jgi:hypothetical protein